MLVVIVGLGEVGTYIAQVLSENKDYNVVGIDIEKEKIDNIKEILDLKTIIGHGVSPHILKEAEVSSADFFIAVSNNEEVNIIASLIAKQLGAKFTIARVNSSFYFDSEHTDEYESLGIDVLLSPERRTALKIFQSIENPLFLKVDMLGGGRININQFMVEESSVFANKRIKDLFLHKDILIVGINRGEEFHFPSGDFRIESNDTLYIAARRQVMERLDLYLPLQSEEVDRIILIGASNINYFLAEMLQQKYRVLLIEEDSEKCLRVATMLDKTAIYKEDIFRTKLLDELLLNSKDYVVVSTDSDETNLLTSILLKDKGLGKVACITHKSNLTPIIKKVGVHQVFSPQTIIGTYITGLMRTQDLISLESFKNAKADFIELKVGKNSQLIGKKIIDVNLPEKTLFIANIRKGKVHIIRGNSSLKIDDRIIILSFQQSLKKIETLIIGK